MRLRRSSTLVDVVRGWTPDDDLVQATLKRVDRLQRFRMRANGGAATVKMVEVYQLFLNAKDFQKKV